MHMMYVTITWYGTLLQREKKMVGLSLVLGLGPLLRKSLNVNFNVTPVRNSIRYKLHMIMINDTYLDEQKKLLIIIFMYICVLILEG